LSRLPNFFSLSSVTFLDCTAFKLAGRPVTFFDLGVRRSLKTSIRTSLPLFTASSLETKDLIRIIYIEFDVIGIIR